MNKLKFHKNIVIATIAIISIGLAIAPTVYIIEAQAQADKRLTGQGTGTLFCPNTSIDNVLLSFDIKKGKGFTDGGWVISIPGTELFLFKDGQISVANLNQKHFNLQGIENQDDLCVLQSQQRLPLKVLVELVQIWNYSC
ncbi:MAG TPA: hypothetical protein VJ697_12800 [Nitrososphaeraceae archaeon]|nr:hypothetical protein [Nitrososphaeraceae archaeon]